jgi:hypothetical protein
MLGLGRTRGIHAQNWRPRGGRRGRGGNGCKLVVVIDRPDCVSTLLPVAIVVGSGEDRLLEDGDGVCVLLPK